MTDYHLRKVWEDFLASYRERAAAEHATSSPEPGSDQEPRSWTCPDCGCQMHGARLSRPERGDLCSECYACRKMDEQSTVEQPKKPGCDGPVRTCVWCGEVQGDLAPGWYRSRKTGDLLCPVCAAAGRTFPSAREDVEALRAKGKEFLGRAASGEEGVGDLFIAGAVACMLADRAPAERPEKSELEALAPDDPPVCARSLSVDSRFSTVDARCAGAQGPETTTHPRSGREHFPECESTRHAERNEMSENKVEHVGSSSNDGVVAKVGLEPQPSDKPKKKGRPRGSKNRSTLQREACQSGVNRTGGQQGNGPCTVPILEPDELRLGMLLAQASAGMDQAAASLAKVGPKEAIAAHPSQLLWVLKALAALKEAQSWLAPAMALTLGAPQVPGGSPVVMLRGGHPWPGLVMRTADNWVEVQTEDELWSGWFDLRTGVLLDGPREGAFLLSDLIRLDLDSLPTPLQDGEA